MSTVGDITIGSYLGRGSFGSVYLCSMKGDRDLKQKAVKVISLNSSGQPDLLEASIMCTYRHPSLNRAISVRADKDRMYIFQNAAKDNLSHYTRKNKVTDLVLRSWCSSIVQALVCLHHERIIHCDLKASNILRYSDNSISVTDFTLATWSPRDDLFSGSICTLTHRPPEVIMGLPWGFPVDVWSLGCTLYEIATGELLIPDQHPLVGDMEDLDKKRKLMSDKTLSSIVQWRRENGEKGAVECQIIDKNYVPVRICKTFLERPEPFQRLVMSMLRFSAEDRPTVSAIFRHEYFDGVVQTPYDVVSTSTSIIPVINQKLFERVTSQMGDLSPDVVKKAREIYSRCTKMRGSETSDMIVACIWIASKVLFSAPPDDITSPLPRIIEYERLICHHLEYRLHKAAINPHIAIK